MRENLTTATAMLYPSARYVTPFGTGTIWGVYPQFDYLDFIIEETKRVEHVHVQDAKPILRHQNSMSETEEREFAAYSIGKSDLSTWFRVRGFDADNLIEAGLAYDAVTMPTKDSLALMRIFSLYEDKKLQKDLFMSLPGLQAEHYKKLLKAGWNAAVDRMAVLFQKGATLDNQTSAKLFKTKSEFEAFFPLENLS